MSSSFFVALSGLRANSTALSVIGNNIANSNTLGFKGSRAAFQDVFSETVAFSSGGSAIPLQVGLGVKVASTVPDFTQGTLQTTNNPTNVAISGNGFFIVKDGSGARFYTRAGDFLPDKDGFLVNSNGLRVQGYLPDSNGKINQSTLQDLAIPIGKTQGPRITTELTLNTNLDSKGDTAFEFNTQAQIFDSLGTSHILSFKFTRTSPPNYEFEVRIDNGPLDPTDATNAAGKGILEFNNTGQLSKITFPSTGTATNVDANNPSITIAFGTPTGGVPDNILPNGASAGPITLKLFDATTGTTNLTALDAPSATASVTQNGAPAGTVTGVSISSDGMIIGVLSSGLTIRLGQLAVATFNAQQALARSSGNLFTETGGSGQPILGTAGSGGRGSITGNALELSNIDLATEFTNLIIAQRGFQSNSRVISTNNTVLQDVLNLI